MTRVAALEVEMRLRPLDRGSMRFRELLARLEARGVPLVSSEDVRVDRHTGLVRQTDGIFVI